MTVRLARQAAIATLTLDRQDKLNAMSDEMWIKLYDHLLDLGIGRAKELVYTARSFSAQEAHEMGIVVRVVADDILESEAGALAEEMTQSATYALALAKKMFQSMAVPTLEMLLETECLASAIVRTTHDHKEAVSAFKEKRPPLFLGR